MAKKPAAKSAKKPSAPQYPVNADWLDQNGAPRPGLVRRIPNHKEQESS